MGKSKRKEYEGKIRYFNHSTGVGEIKFIGNHYPHKKQPVVIHFTNLMNGDVEWILRPGSKVKFEVNEYGDKLVANKVRK